MIHKKTEKLHNDTTLTIFNVFINIAKKCRQRSYKKKCSF